MVGIVIDTCGVAYEQGIVFSQSHEILLLDQLHVDAQLLTSLDELFQCSGIGGRLGIMGVVQDRNIVARNGTSFRCTPALFPIVLKGLDKILLPAGL